MTFSCRCAWAVLALILGSASASSQERRPVVPFEGTQAFRHILQFFRLEPIRDVGDLEHIPADETLIILFGKLDILDELEDQTWRLRRFVERGGSVLIASDYEQDTRLADLGVAVWSGPVGVPPQKGFKSLAACPVITPKEFLADHPVLKDLKVGVATNRPQSLALDKRSSLIPLMLFPNEARTQGGLAPGLFAVASPPDQPPRGRVLVLAGHGGFVNGMLAQPDVDNFAFAWKCIKWLSETPDRRPRRVLFIEEGKPISDFSAPLAQLPPIPVPPARVVNQIIRGMEEEDIFNRLLHEAVGRDEILQGVVLLVSVGLLLVAGHSLLRGRYRMDTGVPLLDPRLEKALSDVPVLSQRHRALLLQGNLFEAAQILAQLWFEQHVPANMMKEPGASPPQAQIRGGWWRRRRLARELNELWEIGFGDRPRPISRRAFERFVMRVERLTTAHADGEVQFA